MELFFTSDKHLGHKNIIEYAGRPFCSVEEMNETLISNHNSVVGPDDICLDLGDVSFRPKKETRKFVQTMNGHKFLFIGNHDRYSKRAWMSMGYAYAICWSTPIAINGIGIGHDPDDVDMFTDTSLRRIIHGHTHQQCINRRTGITHINVCVEVRGYKPVHGRDILNKADYKSVLGHFKERIKR